MRENNQINIDKFKELVADLLEIVLLGPLNAEQLVAKMLGENAVILARARHQPEHV